MAKYFCDSFGVHLACGLCSHGANDHDTPIHPWKEPNKLCTEVHTCEVCPVGVKCIEIGSKEDKYNG